MSTQNPEQHRTSNPDIADTTQDLKALHAQPAVIPPLENQDVKPSFFHRHRKGIAAAALTATGMGVGSFMYVKSTFTDPLNDALKSRPGASAPQVPGQSEPGTRNGQAGGSAEAQTPAKVHWRKIAYFDDEKMSYKEVKTPMVLTPEQATAWTSGDKTEQNNVASDVFAQRFETAIYDVDQATKQGEVADISYISDDPVVYKAIKSITENFAPAPESDFPSFYVCRTNIDYAADDNCNPALSNGQESNFSDSAGMRIVVLRPTGSDISGSNPENGHGFTYDRMHLALDGNNRLALTTLGD